MGYFNYKLLQNISPQKAESKIVAYLRQFERETEARCIEVGLIEGRQCVALSYGYLKREETVLLPIGWQFGCVWMDVRYQDGDWWDISMYQGTQHLCTHNVNPWANEERPDINMEHVEFRINRICEYWPEQAGLIRNYLLLWRFLKKQVGGAKWVPRVGKAYESDNCNYGNADQIHDFVAAFGITSASNVRIIKADE